jgi:hypothetical protein
MCNFESKKAEVLRKIEELQKDYMELSGLISPKFWRAGGHHHGTLRFMLTDISRYTRITPEEAKKQIVLDNYKDNMPENHNIGSWPCPNSPIEVCVYNLDEDPCEDYCIYCGEPDERK